jgi:hypothetical protein
MPHSNAPVVAELPGDASDVESFFSGIKKPIVAQGWLLIAVLQPPQLKVYVGAI